MPGYKSPTKAMKHQSAALRKSASKPSRPSADDVFAYLCEMGTGKSKIALDEWGAGAMNGGPQDLLVLGPAGSYRNWYEDKSDLQRAEINVHLDPDLRRRMIVAPWVSGGGAGVRQRLQYMLATQDPKRPRALFMNTEALSTVQAAKDLVREFLGQRLAYMVVDESTMIRNKSKRTKTIVDLGQEAAVRRILTGLVAPRSPMDLFHQFAFLDWRILGHRSYYSYRARYAVLRKMEVGGRRFDVEVGYRNLEELAELIEPYSYRALKRDCLDLEPKVYTTRDVPLTKEQERHRSELREYATTALGSGSFVTTTLAIQLVQKLHTINMGFVTDENGELHGDIPENRTRVLLEVLTEHGGKAIVWAPYGFAIRRIVAALKREFGEKSTAAFWGGNKKERSEEERRFLGDPECRFMVATQQAGGHGNTWTAADLVVYYGNTFDLEHRDQSEDRAHRRGQQRRVTYVDLIAPGSVDEKIVKALRAKINMTTLISGENYREWII